MRREKLEGLNLYMGIDTIQVKSRSAIEFDSTAFPFVRSEIVRKSDNSCSYYILNPDKGNDNLAIYNCNDYYRTVGFMLDTLKLDTPVKTRIDFRFDSFDKNYNELLKLNKVLLLLIACKYKVRNRYKSQDLLTDEELTMRLQTRYIEAENYNKGLQEPNGFVMNRLELRSKALEHDTPEDKKEWYEFCKWCDRLDKAVSAANFDTLISRTNAALVERYAEWTEKRGHWISNFITHFENCIYTMKQLKQLLFMLGVNNCDQKAKDYKRLYDIECFSLRDLEKYKAKIIRSGVAFFEGIR